MANQEMAKTPAAATEQVAEKGLLDQIVEQGKVGTDAATRERGKSLVKEFINQVLEGQVTISKDTEAMINARVAQIDHLVSIQLNEILHHPQFQKLEGSWRGLKYLLSQSETSPMLKIRVMNVSKKDLLRDLQRAAGIRSERLVQEDIRRRVRGFRRRSLCGDRRRLRVRQASGGPGVAGEGVERCSGCARTILDGCCLATHEYGELHATGPAARHRARFLIPPSSPNGRVSGRATIRGTWGFACRTS